jgi:hypothetical protein
MAELIDVRKDYELVIANNIINDPGLGFSHQEMILIVSSFIIGCVAMSVATLYSITKYYRNIFESNFKQILFAEQIINTFVMSTMFTLNLSKTALASMWNMHPSIEIMLWLTILYGYKPYTFIVGMVAYIIIAIAILALDDMYWLDLFTIYGFTSDMFLALLVFCCMLPEHTTKQKTIDIDTVIRTTSHININKRNIYNTNNSYDRMPWIFLFVAMFTHACGSGLAILYKNYISFIIYGLHGIIVNVFISGYISYPNKDIILQWPIWKTTVIILTCLVIALGCGGISHYLI